MECAIEVVSPLGALGGQLWLVDLRSAANEADPSQLAPWERERAARFRFEKDARRYQAAHLALRQILGQHLRMAPSQVPLQTTPFGKPYIDGHPVHFNMSHSEDWALIGLHTQQIIGVDIEWHHALTDLDALAKQNYTAAEYAALRASADPLAAFLTCWTRKEACLKALGSGFSLEPNQFEAGVHGTSQRVHITTPAKGRCAMVVSNLDFTLLAKKQAHSLPQLYGAIALVDSQHADRVC
jgi:4'-phosphopantetheinyl transferase